MDQTTLDAYFARLAVPRPHTADAVNLHVLHRAHQMTVPFENLNIHLGEPIVLAEHDLMHKIVHRRRGGFCYELNGAMAILLETMGAQVRRVAARVYGEGQAGPPFDHMALVVQATDASGPWLIDVGFGSHSVYPLLYDSRHEQDTRPGGSCSSTLATVTSTCSRTASRSTGSSRANAPWPIRPHLWWQATSPASHFTRSTICSRLTKDGRVSISGRTLITTEGGAHRTATGRRPAVLAAYREHFGIVLDQVPQDLFPPPHAPGPPAVAPPVSGPSVTETRFLRPGGQGEVMQSLLLQQQHDGRQRPLQVGRAGRHHRGHVHWPRSTGRSSSSGPAARLKTASRHRGHQPWDQPL